MSPVEKTAQPCRVNQPKVDVVLEIPGTTSPLRLPRLCPWDGPDVFGADKLAETVFFYVRSELRVPWVGCLEFDCQFRGSGPFFQPVRHKFLFLSEDSRLCPLSSSLQTLQGRVVELYAEGGLVVERITVRPPLDLVGHAVFRFI